ncbi:hypothetical protein ACU4GA_09025 [Methylobacterium oryzae CBMB20]
MYISDDGIDEPYYSEEQAQTDFDFAIMEIILAKKKFETDALINFIIVFACALYFSVIMLSMGFTFNSMVQAVNNLPIVSIIPLGGMCASFVLLIKAQLFRYRAELVLKIYTSDRFRLLLKPKRWQAILTSSVSQGAQGVNLSPWATNWIGQHPPLLRR